MCHDDGLLLLSPQQNTSLRKHMYPSSLCRIAPSHSGDPKNICQIMILEGYIIFSISEVH